MYHRPKPIPLFFLILLQTYKDLRLTLLCDCGLLRDALVTAFHHPWYSGYSDYVGLIDPYGWPWWTFHSLFAVNLQTSIMALTIIDTFILLALYGFLPLKQFLVLAILDSIIWFSAPTDLLVYWILLGGILINPLFSVLAAVTKFPVFVPSLYLNYVLSQPLSHLTIAGSWRYFLFTGMFLFSWWTFWKRRHGK